MNITAVFLFAVCLSAGANGFSQGITLKVRDVPLEQIFEQLEKQSNFTFTYGESVLKNAKPVTIEVSNASIEEVLRLCFRDQPLTYSIIEKTIVIRPKAATVPEPEEIPPPIDVKGRVVNENGEPVAGASVQVKGDKSKGTSTDANGYFELKGVDENATLVISSVNIVTFEVKISGRTDLAILGARTKITEGESVMVEANTGYQKVKPNEIAGSVVVIDNKTLNQQTGINILNRLNNVTSGLYFNLGKSTSLNNPQSTTNITIRGPGTINGPLDPLIVLDNFVYEGDINNINPNDVESITILKDASAASIWGARAGNGVIVITTKKGQFNQKTKVEVNSNLIIQESPDLFDIPLIASGDYIEVEEFLFNNGFFDNTINNTFFQPSLTPAVEIFLKRRDGIINSSDSASQINTLKAIDIRDQYNKYFYRNGITQQYSMNVRGGTDKLAWLVSGAYDRSLSNLNARYSKGNFRFENRYQAFKRLMLTMSLYYTGSRSTTGSQGYNSITVDRRYVPYLRFADDMGNPVSIDQAIRSGYTDTAGGGKLLNWKYYPLIDFRHDRTQANLQQMVANAGLSYQIINGLDFTANYQYQREWVTTERTADTGSYYTRNLINLYTNLNASDPVYRNPVPVGDILTIANSSIQSQSFRSQLNFSKKFAQHNISAIAGAEVREIISKRNDVTYFGYIKDPLSYKSVDFINNYPTYINGNPAGVPGEPYLSPTLINRFVSIYSNMSYTYKNKYTISASARKDASNTFGLSTNDKWNPLWSVGAAWDVSREGFYKSNAIPNLRLKASLGYSGNVDLSRTPLPIGAYGNDLISGFPFVRIHTLSNPSLRWERVKQLNLGIEFSIINRIIFGSIEYYNKDGVDLYGPAPFDYTAWGAYNQLVRNVASMNGRGVDIVINSKNIDRSIKWITSILYSHNKTKTTSYFTDEAQRMSTLLGSGNNITPVIGKPLYAIAALIWGGLDNAGNPQGYLNGSLSTDYDAIMSEVTTKGLESGSMRYIGPANPTSFGSLINEVSFKNLSVSFNFTYRFGYYFLKSGLNYNLLFNTGEGHREFEQRWQKPGDEAHTNVPSLVYSSAPQFVARNSFYSGADIHALKGDHVRLQYVNLDYVINNKNRKLPFESLRIYFNAANLGIVWRANNENLDPDYPSTIAPPRTWTFGLRAAL